MAELKNIVGPQVRNLRSKLGWSQEVLAAKLGVTGWDISRGTLSKIEAQLRCVSDEEVLKLSRALRCGLNELFPPTIRRLWPRTVKE